LSILVLSTAASCNKPDDEPSLPTGENTMYYYMDGTLQIPIASNSIPQTPAIYYNSCSDDISFQICGRPLHIHFYNGIQQTGYITLNQSNFDSCLVPNNHAFFEKNSKVYYTQDGSGMVNITYLSADKRQFKGTFDMTVYDETGATKHLTDGHFNINLDTLND